MPIRPIEKIQHTKDPVNEKQRQYYMTMLLDQINLYRGNISAYNTNKGNHINEADKCQREIDKLTIALKEFETEYKRVKQMDFTKKEEIPEVVEETTEEVPTEETPPEETIDDKLNKELAKQGLTKEKLLEFMKKGEE